MFLMESFAGAKRVFAWFLAAVMVFTMLPAAAMEYLGDVPQEYVEGVTLTPFAAVFEDDYDIASDGGELLLFYGEELEEADEIVPTSGDVLAWYLEITPELVDALNARDGTADFGVIVSGDDSWGIPSFEYIPGESALRVYNRGMPYHAIEILLEGEHFNLVPGVVYNVIVTGSTTAGEFFRIDVPGDGNASGGSWEIVSSPATSATGALLPNISEATFVGQPLEGYRRARIRTNTPWQAPFTDGNPGDTPEFTITSVEIWAIDPGPLNVSFNLRDDWTMQSTFGINERILPYFLNDVIGVDGNGAVVHTAHCSELGLFYLHFGQRLWDTAGVVIHAINEGDVVTVRGRLDGAPPWWGVVYFGLHPWWVTSGTYVSVAEPNGHFAISHTVRDIDVWESLFFQATNCWNTPFYIYDIAITNRSFVGSWEMNAVLGNSPVGGVSDNNCWNCSSSNLCEDCGACFNCGHGVGCSLCGLWCPMCENDGCHECQDWCSNCGGDERCWDCGTCYNCGHGSGCWTCQIWCSNCHGEGCWACGLHQDCWYCHGHGCWECDNGCFNCGTWGFWCDTCGNCLNCWWSGGCWDCGGWCNWCGGAGCLHCWTGDFGVLRVGTATPDKTATSVSVNIYLDENPGFAAKFMVLQYTPHLTLTGYTVGGPGVGNISELNHGFFGPIPGSGIDGCCCTSGFYFFGWGGRTRNLYATGVVLTLHFDIAPLWQLPQGHNWLHVLVHGAWDFGHVSDPPTDIYGNVVHFHRHYGGVNVVPFRFGDANGDGSVNSADTTVLARYLAGEDVHIDLRAMDLNGDGQVTAADLTYLIHWLLRRGTPPGIPTGALAAWDN